MAYKCVTYRHRFLSNICVCNIISDSFAITVLIKCIKKNPHLPRRSTYLIFFKKGGIIYLFRDYQMKTVKICEKGSWSLLWFVWTWGSDLFWRAPLFINVSGLAYGSLIFVENLVQLCIFFKDILIVDDYYKTQSNLFL